MAIFARQSPRNNISSADGDEQAAAAERFGAGTPGPCAGFVTMQEPGAVFSMSDSGSGAGQLS